MHTDEHQDLAELLPWYVTGQLDGPERARVEAHLGGCAQCQAEVRFEQRLEAEVARLPLDVEQGWARMRRRLEADRRKLQGRTAWLGWSVAAAAILGAGVLLLPFLAPSVGEGRYHALGAAPATPAGNVVVIFRPDATEQQMRETLRAGAARLVDGPTPADAYVLHVAPAQRQAALATLRGRRDVVLAQPVDP